MTNPDAHDTPHQTTPESSRQSHPVVPRKAIQHIKLFVGAAMSISTLLSSYQSHSHIIILFLFSSLAAYSVCALPTLSFSWLQVHCPLSHSLGYRCIARSIFLSVAHLSFPSLDPPATGALPAPSFAPDAPPALTFSVARPSFPLLDTPATSALPALSVVCLLPSRVPFSLLRVSLPWLATLALGASLALPFALLCVSSALTCVSKSLHPSRSPAMQTASS